MKLKLNALRGGFGNVVPDDSFFLIASFSFCLLLPKTCFRAKWRYLVTRFVFSFCIATKRKNERYKDY